MATLPLNYLGNTGIKVANISLGTSTFGDQKHAVGRPSADDATAVAIMNAYKEAGGNYIDTADLYSHGEAECIVGQWLASQEREKFVLTSKAGTHIDKSNCNALGSSRKHLVASLEKTLSNLQSPYLDIYLVSVHALMHCFDPMTPVDQVVRTLNDFVRCGKIRHFGVSNYSGWQLQKTVDYCKFAGLEGPCVNQSEYSLLCRGAEFEVTEVCRAEGVSLTPWGALKGGWLSGKFRRDMQGPPSGSRIAWTTQFPGLKNITATKWDTYGANEDFYTLIDIMDEIAKQYNKTVAQVAIKWLLHQDVVPSVVAGAKSVEQLQGQMAAAADDWHLTTEQVHRLNEASEFYPIPDNYTLVRNAAAARLS